jgi:hypothetical protein
VERGVKFIKHFKGGTSYKTLGTSGLGDGVAQSILFPTTDWTAEIRSPAEAKDFSSSLCDQTSSEAHPASYPMGTGGPFRGGKARPEHDANHSPHLVPRS